MAAGLGFKTFTTGEVLTAADTNGYLMQGVNVFADAAARDAAITSPQEGQFAYLKDTDVTTYYTGSVWTNLDTTGMVNPMTITGDTIYSSSGSTPARLGIGSTGDVLTVSAGVPTWAAPAAGSLTLLSTTTLSGTSITLSSISSAYKNLYIVIRNFLPVTDGSTILMRFNNDSTANRHKQGQATISLDNQPFNVTYGQVHVDNDNTVANGLSTILIEDYANTTTWKRAISDAFSINPTTPANMNYRRNVLFYNQTTAISSIGLGCENPNIGGYASGTYTSGTVLLYGVN
jgi:hypothetical protein